MSTAPADIIVHVAGIATGADRSAIERRLGAERGVVRAWMSPHARSLAIVEYDPSVTNARSIRRAIEAQGFSAQLVGL